MKFHVNIQAEATDMTVSQGTERPLDDESRPESRGLVKDTIAWLSSLLIKLGTSLERIAPSKRASPRGFASDQESSSDSDEIRREMTA